MDRGEKAPLQLLERWLEDARKAGVLEPGSVAFVTVDGAGRPSARTVQLKRLEDDALCVHLGAVDAQGA